MSFKIDTKEKFTVITPQNPVFDANIAAQLWETATSGIQEGNPENIIVNLEAVSEASADAMNGLASLHQHLHANKKSFVVCNVQSPVLDVAKKEDIVENLNITPTESEAWDVVQMEEIERELMDDFEGKQDELNP